jgi:hypothetical protein
MTAEILRLKPDQVMTEIRQGKMKVIHEPEPPGNPKSESIKTEKAKEIMGKDFLGPDQIEKAFGIKIKNVPDIQFTIDELKEAKNRGEMLVLYTDKAPDGQPLTMEKMSTLLKPQFDRDSKGEVFRDTQWCQNEEFFKKDVPKVKWGVVGKGFVTNSTSKNYLWQTEALADYVKNTIFKGQRLPADYQDAIMEFDSQKGNLDTLLGKDWNEAGKKLAALKLNQMTRISPVEDTYRHLAYFQTTGDRLFHTAVNWTNTRSSDGYFVSVGFFDAFGVLVLSWGPNDQGRKLGVCFSQ